MRGLLSVLAVVVGSVVVCHGIDVPLCSKDLCSFPAPNGILGDGVRVDDGTSLGCLCPSGREEGTACTEDDHCAKGTLCRYGDLSKTGVDDRVCQSKCSLIKCAQFHRCEMINFEAVCTCRNFECSPSVVASVNAVRQNEKQMFSNMCSLVNTNCDLRMSDPQSHIWVPSA